MKKINFVIVGILLIILIINVKVSANNSLNNVIDSNIINNISNETVDSKNSLDQSNANSNIELKSSNSNVESIETKSIEEGVYRIATSTNSNIVVDISGASKDNQANANLWEYKGEIQQKFKLEYDGNGAYVFRNYIYTTITVLINNPFLRIRTVIFILPYICTWSHSTPFNI